jgi:nicotinamide riboside kinase
MRIGFTGTVSVGKTTLVKELSTLPEFKDYFIATERSKYLRDLGIPLNTDSTLKGQTIFLAERASELIHENLITDRTVIDVMAFTKAAQSIDYYESEKLCELAKHFISEYDYIFYVSPDGVEIEDNSVRTTDSKYRETIDFIINMISEQNKFRMKNFFTISGTTEERVEKIKEIIFG